MTLTEHDQQRYRELLRIVNPTREQIAELAELCAKKHKVGPALLAARRSTDLAATLESLEHSKRTAYAEHLAAVEDEDAERFDGRDYNDQENWR